MRCALIERDGELIEIADAEHIDALSVFVINGDQRKIRLGLELLPTHAPFVRSVSGCDESHIGAPLALQRADTFRQDGGIIAEQSEVLAEEDALVEQKTALGKKSVPGSLTEFDLQLMGLDDGLALPRDGSEQVAGEAMERLDGVDFLLSAGVGPRLFFLLQNRRKRQAGDARDLHFRLAVNAGDREWGGIGFPERKFPVQLNAAGFGAKGIFRTNRAALEMALGGLSRDGEGGLDVFDFQQGGVGRRMSDGESASENLEPSRGAHVDRRLRGSGRLRCDRSRRCERWVDVRRRIATGG